MPRKQTIFAGDKYDTVNGVVEVLEYVSSDEVWVVFLDTRFATSVSAGALRKGLIKDKLKPTLCGVGVLGVGEYSGKTHPKLYKTWNNMINRCYNTNSQMYNPSYEDCTVCEEWLNFQNFARDIESMENYLLLLEGYHLDKDSKVDGNTVYSKETCLIISLSDNSRESANRRWNVR